MVLEQTLGFAERRGNLSRMLEVAIDAARLAGRHAMEEIDFIKASVKNADELVTQADTQCQQIIIDRIRQTYPDHGFIAEEGIGGKLFKQPPRGEERIWWLIDPIDGTNNFAHRMLFFTVSIAAMYQGRSIVGVVFEPATLSMFTAVTGGEAQLNGRRITASEDKMDEFSSIGLDSHFDSEVPAWVREIMKRTRFRSLGSSSLQFAYLARGGLIATISDRPKLWDIAAGVLIAECAGAIASDWNGNKVFPVDLDKYDGGEIPTLAANRKVHAQILKVFHPE